MEKTAKDKNQKVEAKNQENKKVKSKVSESTKKSNEEIIIELKAKLKNQKNNYLSSLADLENDRKIFEKSKGEFIKFANERVIEELISILDTFHMAMNIDKPSPEVKNFLKGFEMIANQFDHLLTNNGVTMIKPQINDQFDSQIHSSVEETKNSEFKSGKITVVIKHGYKIHDRLLRPAMVKVAK